MCVCVHVNSNLGLENNSLQVKADLHFQALNDTIHV